MATETLVGGSRFLEKLRLKQLQQFFAEVRTELKKVSWPGRKEVYGTTVVVICAVFFFATYLALVDLVLRLGVDQIFKIFR
jgi:preprotein translocase subunit SecE